MAEINLLNNLPEINMLDEEGITFDGILNDMIADYEARYRELTGEDLTIYPADSRRIILNVVAGKLYQLAVIMNERHKLNYLQYMYGDYLKNWGSNFGFSNTGLEKATTVLRFTLSGVNDTDVLIPAGTRATSGDKVYFAVDEDTVIPSGDEYVDTSATCTVSGSNGNGYMAGQINIIVDPINLVESVENITQSSGGHDEYTDQELRELIYYYPDEYSAAGSEGSYRELTKQYSNNIVDVRIVTTLEAEVYIYILLQNGKIPSDDYCSNVYDFIKDTKRTPDTDKIQVLPPSIVNYDIEAVYYISEDNKEIADGIKEAVTDAVDGFAEYVQSHIGRSINPNVLIAYTNAAGASRLEVKSPEYMDIGEEEVAVCSNINLTFGGFSKE